MPKSEPILNAQLEELFRYSMDGVIYASTEGQILAVNPAFCKLTGFSGEELVGKKCYQDLTPNEFWDPDMEVDRQVMRSGQPMEVEKVYLTKSGERVPVLITVFPVIGEAGAIKALGAFVKDITEQKAMQKELERSNQELENFASMASHDLREPLAIVSNALELVADQAADRLDAESRLLIEYAKNASARLARLISELLDYARAGSEPAPSEPVCAEQCFQGAVGSLKYAIEESAAVISHGPLPKLRTDGVLLEQIFQNLLSNAIKYCKGTPRIRVEASLGADRKWEFRVTDNGPGIENAQRERVFDLFDRGDPQATDGTGIGLALCRRAVSRLGGRIWNEPTKPGPGTVFCFTLPNSLS